MRRAGHSLPELIVATTFLAATLVAVGGSAVLGARWTARAATVQRAVRIAEHVLDSLAALPTPAGTDRIEAEGLHVAWTVAGTDLRVEVTPAAGGPALVTLHGTRLPTLPVLPDVGGASP